MAAGYRRLLPDHPGPVHASTWCRGREAITVDLHRSLPGATSVPERQWVALAAHTERVALDGGEVEALDLDARLVLLALHAAHHGIGVPNPLSDLRVGLAKTTDTDWSRAVLLARELGAEAALVSGLRLLDGGPSAGTTDWRWMSPSNAQPRPAGSDSAAHGPSGSSGLTTYTGVSIEHACSSAS